MENSALDPGLVAIIVSIIGGGFTLFGLVVSNRNKKATKGITDILANTKEPVDSLDQVIKVLQDELAKANTRHEAERKFFTEEIARVRDQNREDRVQFEEIERELRGEISQLKDERLGLLEQIRGLKNQLNDLEVKVRTSLGEDEPERRNGATTN
jgi:chromosome segregation ATPase